jgi:Sulfotransferase domain
VPAAATTGPPDFIGVGTQRSGTTWWFEMLLGHPRIRPPRGRRKELHFFDRFGGRELTDADVAAYHELFPRRPRQVAGEWTPRYMHDFWTPPLLARAAPEAKLLVMFRDPIERFRSGVPHRISRTPNARIEAATADAIERGRYATQLRRVLACHDESKLLILQYEKCVADPAGQLRRTLRFLGVDDSYRHEGFQEQRGTTQAARKQPLPAGLVEGLQATLEPEVARLATMTPEIDVSLWRNFAHLAGSGRTADALSA